MSGKIKLLAKEGRDLLKYIDKGATYDKIESPYNKPTNCDPQTVSYTLTESEAAEVRAAAKEMAKSAFPWNIRAAKAILLQI